MQDKSIIKPKAPSHIENPNKSPAISFKALGILGIIASVCGIILSSFYEIHHYTWGASKAEELVNNIMNVVESLKTTVTVAASFVILFLSILLLGISSLIKAISNRAHSNQEHKP
ncbi:MAG: hypothetical protein DRP65_00500 [Planctomycetota bacterium]|nr:MAG: hypothetical protein DRP65_00500 [Planctomycetota bacterium]